MADQQSDFHIKVVTTADTSGLKQASAELQKLRQDSLRGAFSAPIPAGLTGGEEKAAEEAVQKSEVAALAQRAIGRTVATIFRSFIGLAAVETVARKLNEWAENIKKAAEEQRALNQEIDKAVKGYQDIHNLATWDKENDKIEENIQKLRERKRLITDPDELQALTKEIAARERQQQNLAIQTQRGYERAQAEEKVRVSIREQVDAMAEGDKKAKTSLDTAKAQRAEAEKNLQQLEATEASQVQARADAARLAQASKDADEKAVKAKKDLADAEKQSRQDPGSVDVRAARERANLTEREAQEMRTLASSAEAYTRQLDHGRDALSDQLTTSKAIADERRREEKEARQREKDELEKRVPGLTGEQPIKEASQQVQAILKNEQAAAQALKEGREQDADMFTKSADEFKAGLKPDQAAELARIRKLMGGDAGASPGRKAGIGESQALVDEQERNRLAAANQPVEASPEAKVGGTGTDAQAAGFQELAEAIKNSEDAAKARHEEQMTLQREQLRQWQQ